MCKARYIKRAELSLKENIEGQLRGAYMMRHARNGLTQTEMAEDLSVCLCTVQNRLEGKRNMTIKAIADMVWVLGCGIDVRIFDAKSHRRVRFLS